MHEWDGSLQSLCPLLMFCREESLCQYTKCQRTRRDASKLSKSTLAVLFPSVIFHPRWQSWYFRKSKALHIKGRLGHCFTSLLLLFVVQCRFFGSLMGRGHQLVVPHSIAQSIQFTQLPFGAKLLPLSASSRSQLADSYPWACSSPGNVHLHWMRTWVVYKWNSNKCLKISHRPFH